MDKRVLAVQVKATGRWGLLYFHGSVGQLVRTARAASNWSEAFWQQWLPAMHDWMRSRLTAWQLMTPDEAQAWLDAAGTDEPGPPPGR